MGRHGKNATASAVYSYHERKKDTGSYYVDAGRASITFCIRFFMCTVEGQYGRQSMRLGKDSIKVSTRPVCIEQTSFLSPRTLTVAA